MTQKQIWTIIIGSGLVASITTAATFYPQQAVILSASAALVTAVVSYITGRSEE